MQTLCNFLTQKFEEDEEIFTVLESFVNFDTNADLEKVHTLIASDLCPTTLDLEYFELVEIFSEKLKTLPLPEKMKAIGQLNNYPIITKILVRIVAAKPHSADVESLISISNKFKTSLRSSITVDTENLYLYIYFNVLDLEHWDPRPAITKLLESKQRRQKDRAP